MTLETEKIEEQISKIFQQHFFTPTNGTPLLDQLSSIELVHLVTELEKTFKISVSALEINEASFKNIESLSQYIRRKSIS